MERAIATLATLLVAFTLTGALAPGASRPDANSDAAPPHRYNPIAAQTTRQAGPALRLSVRPAQIAVGRDVLLHVMVTDAAGRPVEGAMISITGGERPLYGRTSHGRLAVTVRAAAPGKMLLLATRGAAISAARILPIVPGSPATVQAIRGGLRVLPPRQKARPGRVGADLFNAYHALTGARQLASLALRNGTLVDLNSDTDVLIKDPLHQRLTTGEVFLEVVRGSSGDQVQAGNVVAATRHTRFDVKANSRTGVVAVTVVEGLVQVSSSGRSVAVGGGQQTTVVGNGPPSPPRSVNLATVLGWLQNLPNSNAGAVPPVLIVPPPPPIAAIRPPGVAPTPAVTITGALTSTVWSGGPYLLSGSLSVPAAQSLTIQPGTIVEMGRDAVLTVYGTLQAVGTAGAPITFMSATAAKRGAWGYVDLYGTQASGSVLDHVALFDGGGATNGYYGDAELRVDSGANPTIEHCLLAQSLGDGLYVGTGARPILSDDTFAGNGGYGASLPPDAVAQLRQAHPADATQGVEVQAGAVAHDGTWAPQDAALSVNGGVSLPAGTTLQLAAGTLLQMGRNGSLTVAGTLRAQGTATAPISVTSALSQPVPGAWGAIRLEGATASGSVLDHVWVAYGGNADQGEELEIGGGASPLLRDCVFMQSAGPALYVDQDNIASSVGRTHPTLLRTTLAGPGPDGASLPPDTVAVLHATRLVGGAQGVQIRGGSLAQDGLWPQPDAPLLLASSLSVPAGRRLTIQPGTILAMGHDAVLTVYGTLYAVGTSAMPISVRSAAAHPTPGAWGYVDLYGTQASGSVLDYMSFSNGGGATNGYYGDAELRVDSGASPTIQHCLLAHSLGDGLYVVAGHPTIANCEFRSDAGHAISLPARDSTHVYGNRFAPGQAGLEIRA